MRFSFSLKTELVNTITHVPGILFGLVFIPLLLHRSFMHDSIFQITGNAVYGFFFLTTFILSTLFHATHRSQLKTKFRILDHISIYLFIAATYTPFVLKFMFNKTGVVLLILIWAFAILGSFLKWYYLNRFALLSVVSYVIMGLLFLSVRKQFFANMPPAISTFIYYGVALYLIGVIFFLWRKWKHHHALWHLFVLAGALCHFKAVWLTIG